MSWRDIRDKSTEWAVSIRVVDNSKTMYKVLECNNGLVYGQSRLNVSQWSNELARSGKHSPREMHEGLK